MPGFCRVEELRTPLTCHCSNLLFLCNHAYLGSGAVVSRDEDGTTPEGTSSRILFLVRNCRYKALIVVRNDFSAAPSC